MRVGAGGGATASTLRFGGAGAYTVGVRNFGPRTPVQVPRNPIKNGKQELCDICGSWSHSYNPHVQAMMEIVDSKDNEDRYHGDHVYVSTQPEIINTTDGNVPDPEGEDRKAVDHVGALIATLTTRGLRRSTCWSATFSTWTYEGEGGRNGHRVCQVCQQHEVDKFLPCISSSKH